MIELDLKVKNNIGKVTDKISQALKKFPSEVHKKLVDNTPVDKGHARRNTRLRGNKIEANYPYAQVLDQGRGKRDGQMRGSEQAPEGMTKPTMQWAKKRIAEILRRRG